MMYRNASSARRLAAATALALLTACTTIPAPVQKVAEAEHAVRAASAGDATTLAPAELDKAHRKLEAARSALQVRNHVLARQLAEQAVVDAEFAQVAPRAEKTEWAAAAPFLADAPDTWQAVTVTQARSALEVASSTRAVRVYAALELNAAERALERALAAVDAEGPPSEIEHLAYLAERRVAIARMYAKERWSTDLAASATTTAQPPIIATAIAVLVEDGPTWIPAISQPVASDPPGR